MARIFTSPPTSADLPFLAGDIVVSSNSLQTYTNSGWITSQNDVVLPGTTYCVNSVTGSDAANGLSWSTPLKTITAAVALAVAGDTILIKGSFIEAVTIAVAKTGLKIIGAGTNPDQAKWTGAADAVCLTINATDVLVRNIKFTPPVYGSGTPAAILLGSANYAKISGNRFQGTTGSYYAIYSPVCNSDNVEISDNEFIYMNTLTNGAAILGVEAGGLSYSSWKILRNIFNSCVTAININGRVCTVAGNIIQEYGITALGAVGVVLSCGIDLSGTSSGSNAVTGNQLGGTFGSPLYIKAASGDQWAGNLNVISGGVTAANP